MLHRAPLLLLAALAAGCGQKGPLILPDAHTREPVMRPAPATATTPAPSKDERKKPPQ